MFTVTDAFSRMHSMATVQATYWELYAVVTLALVTYTGSIWGRKRPVQLYMFLAVSFSVFAISNVIEIYHLQLGIELAANAIEEYTAANINQIDPIFLPITGQIFTPSIRLVVGFHLLLDSIVLGVIFGAYKAASPDRKFFANKQFKSDS